MSVQFAPPRHAVPLPPVSSPERRASPAAQGENWIERGTRDYGRASLGLFFVGFASFALIYGVQPVLPAFAASFGLSPAESSLAMSLTTGFLAASIMASVMVSHALGRRGVICWSMALGAAFNLAAALSPSWHGLLIARALVGVVLGGVPAVATAYLSEEIEPKSLGRAMGLYIAGNALGGLMGRVGTGVLSEFSSWRVAMAALGALCLISAIVAFWLLPVSRNFAPTRGLSPLSHLRIWGAQLRTPRLLGLFAMACALLGIYVTIYNYVAFRLAEPPFGMSQTAISMIFLCVVAGIASSSVSGPLSDRYGKRAVLVAAFALILAGVALTNSQSLAAIVAGIAAVTAGFFLAHPIASASVGPLSGAAKGHSAALYLLFFYVGSSVIGSLGGVVWQHGGWSAVAGLCAGLALAGLAISLTVTKPA